ncbi:MAG: hypothetical protein ACI8ZB_001509 [Desulforhopalus sp.]|jgi:hypothetical protein
MYEKTNDKLELSDMIKELRLQLSNAQKDGNGEDIRFIVDDVELELQITVEKQVQGGMSAKFFVLTSKVDGSDKNTVSQKLKLKFKALNETFDPETGKKKIVPCKISGEV